MDKTNTKSRFQFCISLGDGCRTAGCLGKAGLRSFSGPFDWCTSPKLSSVLKIIEDDFKDFLQRDNLLWNSLSPTVFTDKKYNFNFPHDIKKSLDVEYEAVFQKYQRRICKFRDAVSKPTVFFRMIWTDDEVRWIKQNRAYIDSVIQRGNSGNRILFCYIEGVVSEKLEGSFSCREKKNTHGIYNYITWFDSSPDLLEYCSSLISREERVVNTKFFFNSLLKSSRATNIALELFKTNSFVRSTFLAFFEGKSWYIWGAGFYGKAAKALLEAEGISIQGFIDSSIDKIGKEFNGIRIYNWEEISSEAENIFIVIGNDDTRKSIKDSIYESPPLGVQFATAKI